MSFERYGLTRSDTQWVVAEDQDLVLPLTGGHYAKISTLPTPSLDVYNLAGALMGWVELRSPTAEGKVQEGTNLVEFLLLRGHGPASMAEFLNETRYQKVVP